MKNFRDVILSCIMLSMRYTIRLYGSIKIESQRDMCNNAMNDIRTKAGRNLSSFFCDVLYFKWEMECREESDYGASLAGCTGFNGSGYVQILYIFFRCLLH